MKVVKAGFKIETPLNGEEILKHIERCGRTCYKSEWRIGPDTAPKFVAGIIKRGHESVLEHFSFTVRFVNDRGVSHEEVRQRIASFSQESTRYCNYYEPEETDNGGIQCIDLLPGINLDTKMKNLPNWQKDDIIQEWLNAMLDSEKHYNKMIELGCTPQIARSVLANSLKTEIVITANLREWRTILKQRTSIAAHPQMREVMIPLLMELQKLIPVVFDDIQVAA